MIAQELKDIAQEIDATIESCFALGFHLEDRVEIISEILIEKFHIIVEGNTEAFLEGIDKTEE
jgi:hypothetical protein